ncbi:MAG: hypothetical protein ABI678_14855 [Kofleriaceae bacterium]
MIRFVLLSALLAACTSDHLSDSNAALTGGCGYGGSGCGSDTGSGSGGSGSGSDCYELADDATTTSTARMAPGFTACTYGGCGSNTGSGSDAPPVDPPHSTITITHDDGNSTSQHPGPATTGLHCTIPQDVLATLPIYNGQPTMKSCTVDTYISGTPPSSVGTYLNCTNGTGQGGYDHFSCTSQASFIPPSASITGYFSYGKPGGGTPDIAAETCQAWIQRAQGICTQTGVQAE